MVLCGLALIGLLNTPWLRARPLNLGCDEFLSQPAAGWLTLSGCVLDMEQVVLESETGDFEPLAGRREGLWRTLPQGPVRWSVVWAPLKQPFGGRGVVQAVYRLDGADLLKWVNDFDRASPAEKERLWADPVPLRRLLRPARIEGHAEKPGDEGLRKAYGPLASANLVAVTPGQIPRPPVASIVGGGVGLLLLGYTLLRAFRGAGKEPLDDSLRYLGVNQVKLEIGGLEELRKEERAERRSGRPPTE